MRENKRGLSPVVATMLLIVIVIVIALIIFLWLRGLNEEAITKFDGTNVKLVCEDVFFDASFLQTGNNIYIQNIGNVPIYQIKAQVYSAGSHETITFETDWPSNGLNPGSSYAGVLNQASGADRILLLPVLRGHSKSGEKTYTCDERHGYEIIV
ncbi:MAG: hypothetical protein KC516_00955 [Nanoarchaeota archaeon]|nr:hypothetical protein [Nanoarchaeota archaeon]